MRYPSLDRFGFAAEIVHTHRALAASAWRALDWGSAGNDNLLFLLSTVDGEAPCELAPHSTPSAYAQCVQELDNFGAYLARLGLGPEPSFFELHRAHVVSVPWDKLVALRRGGYCFEQNLLFMSALRSIGIEEIVPVLARVRRGDPNLLRPFGHIALCAKTDGRNWLADVGLAQGRLLDPIPMEPGLEHEQPGWRFRLVEDGPLLVWQSLEDGEWRDGYAFAPEPAPLVDIEVCNWYTATHPGSPFVTGLRCATVELIGDC
jgi:N-acetyltransferase